MIVFMGAGLWAEAQNQKLRKSLRDNADGVFRGDTGTYFRSEEHAERFPCKNRWRLYNAFTETFKQESVTLQADSFRALGRALCTKVN